MMRADVFERSGSDTMTRNAFYFVMGCILSWGFVATYMVSNLTANWRPGLMEFLLVGLVLPLVGILLSVSGSAFVSFLGFNLVAIPFGAVLGPVLAQYQVMYPGIVSEAATLTAAVTGVMAVSGLMFPDFYRSIGGALFGALTALVLVSLASLFVPALANFTVIHYIAAGIFALYIGYDMHRASEIPATLDNAVDVCVSLYLDILNLFLRILEILAKSKK
jgi:FtsH-binding integral membrane protein